MWPECGQRELGSTDTKNMISRTTEYSVRRYRTGRQGGTTLNGTTLKGTPLDGATSTGWCGTALTRAMGPWLRITPSMPCTDVEA